MIISHPTNENYRKGWDAIFGGYVEPTICASCYQVLDGVELYAGKVKPMCHGCYGEEVKDADDQRSVTRSSR